MFIRRIGFPQVCFDAEGSGGAGDGSAAASASSAPASGVPTTPAASASPSASSPKSTPTPTPASPSPAKASAEGGPSPQPVPTTPPAEAPPSLDDFSNLGFSDDDDDDFESQPSTKSPTAPPADAPKPAAATPPAEPVPPQATPAQPTQPKPGEPGQPEAATSIPSPAEPLRMAEALEQNAAALIDHLAQTEFKLSTEDVEALETDAPAHIPKLLARVFHRMTVTMHKQLAQAVPAMIARQQQVVERNATSKAKFYAKWPDLTPADHGEVVDRYAKLYRQANPQATFDQMVDDLGPMVMIAAKVTPGTGQPHVGANGTSHVAPLRTPPPSPFKPAMGGPAAPPQRTDVNPWEGMAPSVDDSE